MSTDHEPAKEHRHRHEHGHHDHARGHDHGRAFAIGVALNLAFVVIEVLFGLLADSMALLADAGHNLSDVLALGLAWGAAVLAQREPSLRFTYGLRSTSILAALVNAMSLMLVVGGIAWQAILRLSAPVPVAGSTVIWVAAAGIVINTGTALLFVQRQQIGGREDMNLRAAFLHMAADALVSLGVVLAGVAMLYTGWMWLDPAVSLIIAVIIVAGTWGLLRDSVGLALQAVPPGIDAARIRDYLASLDGVTEVHDLHIWGMSTTDVALTAHLVIPSGHPGDQFLNAACHELHARFHVGHATLQLETGDTRYPCALAPADVV